MSIAELEGAYGAPGPAGHSQGLVPPQDVDAERSVLGGMLLSKDAIADATEAVGGSDFYRPAHEQIYEAIIDLYGRGEPADAITVADELTKRGELQRIGGQAYLHELVQAVPTAANAGFYASIVAERAVLRRLVEAGTRIAQMGYADGGGDVVDVINAAQAEIFGVTASKEAEDYVRIGDVIEATADEIDAASGSAGQMTGVPTGFTDLDTLTNGLHPGQMIVVAARPAVGKALALDTPLPTPTGWTTMGEVGVGDELLGADGRPTRVVAATPVMVGRPCYEVEFSDGTVIVADEQHQWVTDTRASRRSEQAARDYRNRMRHQRTLPAVRTTAEIARTLRLDTEERRLNHSVRLTQVLDLPDRQLLLPPYVVGAWLGDGTASCAAVTTADDDMVLNLEAEGLRVTHTSAKMRYSLRFPDRPSPVRSCRVCGSSFVPRTSQVLACGRHCGGRLPKDQGGAPDPCCPDCGARSSGLRRCNKCHGEHGTVQACLRTLGILGDKHIPYEYLRASEPQRRALLAGLVDTDGTVTASGCVQFTTTNERLSMDAIDLVVGLGYRCSVCRKRVDGRREESSTAFTLTFSADDGVFRLERKNLLHKERRTRTFQRRNSRFIVDVRPISSVPVRCVEVDNDSHLYLASRSMIPTHNSTLGLDVARSASIKHDQTSVIFSLEMSKTEITMRLLSAEAGIQLQHMRKGTMRDEDWTKLAATMGRIADAPLFIDDSPNMSLMEIRSKCRRLKERNNLKLVIIDYLQLMTSGKRVESRQQEVSEFSRALKLLAKELNVPVIAISQLNRGPEQRTDKRPQMSDLRESGCLTGDTRLLRADTGAETSIGELAASGKTEVAVWALDDSLRYVARPLTHAFSTGTRPVFRLTLASGKTLRATENHRFMTYDGWKPLGDIRTGERLAVPRHVPAPQQLQRAADDESEDDYSELADKPRLAEMAELWSSRTPFLPRNYRRETRGCTLGVDVIPEEMRELTPDLCCLPKQFIAYFIDRLWRLDGRVDRDEFGLGSIWLAAKSRRLLEDVARLLLRFGIGTRIAATKDGWRLHIDGVDHQRRFLQEVHTHQERTPVEAAVLARVRDDTERRDAAPVEEELRNGIREVVGAVAGGAATDGEPLAKVVSIFDGAELDVEAINDVHWDPVVSIESDGVEEVFDATVVGCHNFIANGVAAHNSIEQDADMVILLHREDSYDKESERAGEADLIVAKHRNGPTDTITVAFQGHYSRFTNMAQNF